MCVERTGCLCLIGGSCWPTATDHWRRRDSWPLPSGSTSFCPFWSSSNWNWNRNCLCRSTWKSCSWSWSTPTSAVGLALCRPANARFPHRTRSHLMQRFLPYSLPSAWCCVCWAVLRKMESVDGTLRWASNPLLKNITDRPTSTKHVANNQWYSGQTFNRSKAPKPERRAQAKQSD